MKKAIVITVVTFVIGIAALALMKGSDNNTSTVSSSTPSKIITAQEVSAHASKNDCWTVIDKNVYNITDYVPRHPGGVEEISKACGTDGSSLFKGMPKHNGSEAKNQLARLQIGALN